MSHAFNPGVRYAGALAIVALRLAAARARASNGTLVDLSQAVPGGGSPDTAVVDPAKLDDLAGVGMEEP